MRRSRLRTYAPLAAQSDKVKDEAAAFRAVYALVDARSDGQCEVTRVETFEDARFEAFKLGELAALGALTRCHRRAVEHHHLFQPRRSHHTPEQIVHVCRPCHDLCTRPFHRGRLSYLGLARAAFLFALRTASSKFAARGQG